MTSPAKKQEWVCPSGDGCEGQWVDCWAGCEEGYFDEHDDDPINYAPGEEFATCEHCHGKGGYTICANVEADQ